MKKIVLLTVIVSLAFSTSTFAVDRTWNFMNWSATTLSNMAADTIVNWKQESITRFSNRVAFTAGSVITANGIVVSEISGLTFGTLGAGKLRIDFNTNPGRLMLNGGGLIINVPDCAAGDTLVVYTKTATTGNARGVTVTNAVRVSGLDLSADSLINVFTVTAAGTVPITTTAGLHFRLIAVSAPGSPAVNPLSTGISTPTLNAVPVKTVYYSLSGTVAGHDFASLRKGLYIQKTWYSNGVVQNSKFVKASE